MRRASVSFVLLLALALGMMMLPSVAAEDDTIYFTAVNNILLELNSETMPIKHNSMLYVPVSVFNSTELGTYALYSRENQKALISDGSGFLYFDMSAGNSYDSDGNSYYYAALYQNGTAYIPAYFTATHFGLTCSYIRRDGKHIVRLIKGEALSDDDFIDAASYLMEKSLTQYLRSLASASPASGATPVPTPLTTSAAPHTARPLVSPTPVADHSDTDVYLHIAGLTSRSGELLDALEAQGLPACFYATAQEVEEYGDFVRRLLGSGYRLGVLFQEAPAAEYEAFSLALRNAAMEVSFLAAMPQTLSPEAMAEAEALGLKLTIGDFQNTDTEYCMLYLAAAGRRTDLLLSGSYSDMNRLTRRIVQEKYTVLPVSELS